MKIKDLLVSAGVLLAGRGKAHDPDEDRIVEKGSKSPGAESLVIALFFLAALMAIGFIVVYAFDHLSFQTQFLGLAIGLSLLFLAAACVVIAKRLVVSEEIVEEYPPESHPEEERELTQIVDESGSRFTRKRLVLLAGSSAVGALGLAAITPAVSMGPVFDTDPFYWTPWHRGRRLVGENGHPIAAADVAQETFYTAYPEGEDRELLGSPLVVVRLDPSAIEPDRRSWSPQGILAFSKICTHAGCAISLYRKPTYAPTQPRPALVCPCHYSTFDPAQGGKVLFGPAGRPLPQLPLYVDRKGNLRAAGPFSGPIGPGWWGVRMRKRSTT